MITTALIALMTTVGPAPALSAGLVCPVMGNKVPAEVKVYEYAGMRLGFCCAGCETKMEADPVATLKNAAAKKWVVAEFMFDPVSGQRITPRGAKGKVEFGGVRYFFTTKENADAFKKNTAKYAAQPSKECLAVCAVTQEEIGSYAKAGFYRDFEGVRYYICCGGCVPNFEKTPKVFAEKVADKVTVPHLGGAK